MFRYFVFLFIINISLSSSSTMQLLSPTSIASTINKMINEKIVNGQIAERGKFPYHSVILLKLKIEREFLLCGGSILNNKVIASAAHCFRNAEHALIILGAHDLIANETDVIRVLTNQSHFKIHPEFDFQRAQYDIGLIILPEPINFNKFIQPIALPSNFQLDESFAGETSLIAGHGKLCDSCGSSSVLRFTENRIMSNEECSHYYLPDFIPSQTQMCLSTADIRSSPCRGDSGGGAVVKRNNSTLLIGLSSFGDSKCEDGKPTVFTRLTREIVEWINGELAKVD